MQRGQTDGRTICKHYEKMYECLETPAGPSQTGWEVTAELDDLVSEAQAAVNQSHSLEPLSHWGVLQKHSKQIFRTNNKEEFCFCKCVK